MKSENDVVESDSIELFVRLSMGAADQLRRAAGVLQRLMVGNPNLIQEIRERHPSYPPGLLLGLVRVAEGSLHPELLLSSCPAYRKLRTLPYFVQKRILDNGAIECVIDADTGDVRRIPIAEVEAANIKQVFGSDGLRSVGEQQAWLKRKQSPRVAQPIRLAFVKQNRLVLTGVAGELSRIEVLRLLEEMG